MLSALSEEALSPASIAHRGGKLAFAALSSEFGDELVTCLPTLLADPVAALTQMTSLGNETLSTQMQQLVDTLTILEGQNTCMLVSHKASVFLILDCS